jgi:hypothetical protein
MTLPMVLSDTIIPNSKSIEKAEQVKGLNNFRDPTSNGLLVD